MNIGIISFSDHDVTKGVELLIEKYKDKNPTILLPVLKHDNKFSQSVLRPAIDHGVPVTCFFESAVGLDHLLKQANDISLTENPIKEVIRHLKPNDAMAMVWDDSPQAHFILHGTEDLALETWDIYDGMDVLETEDFDFPFGEQELHTEMIATMGKFVDLMCAFVAQTVMTSLSEAVAEHIMLADEDGDIKDIDPFNNME